MEKADRERVIRELTQGMELSNKLKEQLHKGTCDSRDEACGFLVDKIVSCYDNALSLLNGMGFLENQHSITLTQDGLTTDVSDLGLFKDRLSQVVNKKRNNLPFWSEQVRDEIQVDDGFNWRKYGQKDIQGATHPRSYYRCSHRYTQGCLATKQVQRGEDDPCTSKVAYRGKHSCVVIKQTDENVNAEMNDEDMMINIESDTNAVEPQQLISSETQVLSKPTEELYFAMPSNYNIRIGHSFLAAEPQLPEMMISNLSSTPNEDSDFLIDPIHFDSGFSEDAADYFSLVQGSPERKII